MILDQEGFIEVICGPMFSGKTTELIKNIETLNSLKKKFLVFKPSIDKRYSLKSELVTHDLKTVPSLLVNKSSDILDIIKENEKIEYLIIDEIQFFDKDIEKILNNLSYKGMKIIIAGLELDYRGEPFGSMPYLLSISDKVTKLQSFCFICGKEATRTQRIFSNKKANDEEQPVILIGGNNYHKSCCRKCHNF
ncbi:MAG: thymidine kinase [Candidatus Phytoplasma pruni]|uniref:thymidine kinase n=1 Tax=Milkweed yellows phytoplasma TaxID=208434 RepID=UPI000368044A|nr:thymidine kinase [Milkweed yellows phytoplasma]